MTMSKSQPPLPAQAVAVTDGGSAPATFAVDASVSGTPDAIDAGPPSADLVAAIAAASATNVSDAALSAIDGGSGPGG